MRRLHLVSMIALFAVASAPLFAATGGSVSGVVRDSSGVPQMGAVVQLLRPDMSVIAVGLHQQQGHLHIRQDILPGNYAVKAMGALFLPSLRENVRVRTNTVVNLTLNTLYEVMQWLPAEPRAANASKDDWEWTLRSAANRPLLALAGGWAAGGGFRWLRVRHPKLKARLMASGQEGTFRGERRAIYGQRGRYARQTAVNCWLVWILLRTQMPGWSRCLASARTWALRARLQSMAAISIHPEIEGSGGEGLDEAAMRSSEKMNLGDEFEIEAGAAASDGAIQPEFAEHSAGRRLPFATVAWHGGNSTVSYRMATGSLGSRSG